MNHQQLAAVKLALGALEESVDLVQEDYENAKKLYGNYPTRQARLLGMEEGLKKHEEAIAALQPIIEQPTPVQEPVAVVTGYYGGRCVILPTNPARLFNSGTALYTTPHEQQKPWVDLPDEEIDALAELYGLDYMSYAPFVRAVEQLLKEKNHG
jgi:hypothetical protein